MTIFEEKKLLRAKIKSVLRQKYSDETARQKASLEVCKKIERDSFYRSTEMIFFYIPCGVELDVLPLLKSALKSNRRVCVPRVINGTSLMEFYFLEKSLSLEEQLETGAFGISEPKETLQKVELNDSLKGKKIFMIVPGLAFTEDGKRLGKGKGFYDRYIPRLKATGCELCTAGTGYEEQLLKHIPEEETDFTLDKVMIFNH